MSELISNMKTSPIEFASPCIGNKCYRREIVEAAFEDIGDVDISFHEDSLFALAAFLRSEKISFRYDCFYKYIQRNNSIRNRFNDRAVDEETTFIARIENLMQTAACMSSKQIEKCLDSYCAESVGHVWGMFIANRVKYDVGIRVLRQLIESKFFVRFEHARTASKIMLLSLHHPMAYCRIAPALYYANAIRKKIRDCGVLSKR